jgi:hypothetical protein
VADTLAKETDQDDKDRNIVYDRIPISTTATRRAQKGQAQWERAEKAA